MSKPKPKTKGAKAEKPSLRARFKFTDTDQHFEIDVFDLKSEEQIMIEAFFDKPWNRLLETGWLVESMTGKVYLAFLARRRQEPDFTYEQALEFDPVGAPGEDGERPTPGGSKSSGSRS